MEQQGHCEGFIELNIKHSVHQHQMVSYADVATRAKSIKATGNTQYI